MDCLGEEHETIKKVNKAAPSSVTWLESFFFIVTSTSQVVVRLQVLHKAGSLQSMGKAMTGAVSTLAGGSGAVKDKVLGTIELPLSDIIKSNGTLEVDGMYFGSDYAHGEISCSLEFKMNQPTPSE